MRARAPTGWPGRGSESIGFGLKPIADQPNSLLDYQCLIGLICCPTGWNAFNHPVFGTPDLSLDDGSFGTISYTSNTPREVQLAIKFNF